MSDREEQRQRALALLAKSLKKRPPSEEERAREERGFLKSALALADDAELRGALSDRLSVLSAQARAQADVPARGGAAAEGGAAAAADEARVEPMRALLEEWRDGDFLRAPAELLELGFWRGLALGAGDATGRPSAATPPPPGSASDAASAAWRAEAARIRRSLASDGYVVSLPSGAAGDDAAPSAGARGPYADVAGSDAASGWGWGAQGSAAVGSLAAAAERLAGLGWPPVFVFMLDEAWAVAERAWPLLAHALADEAGGAPAEECGLDSSVFCWIAQRAAPAGGGAAAPEGGAARPPPGANFGTPHRDFSALESLRESDGAPALLSAWVPLTAVSARNGAMSVLPREADAHFNKRWAYAHMRPGLHEDGGVLELRFDLAAAVQLAPLPVGALLAWCGNTVHWGGRCSAREPAARVALGFNFVAAGVRLQSGRPPLRRAELRAAGGLSASQRLSIVAGSLLLYSNWYELGERVLPPGAVLPARRAAAPTGAGASAAGAASGAASGASPAPHGRPATAGGTPAPVGVRADGQPQYLSDSARQALYAKYGDLSAIRGDPKDLEGNCAMQ